ncbi:MAG: hypothetical protein JNK63_07030 [Chthonomonas sp.]|nr:hypothetical protein [Chthonomonas sp.]
MSENDSPITEAQVEPDAVADAGTSDRSPWLFTPALYFMQAIPVTLVQEVSTIVFKSLGVENQQIATAVSLIALPWSMQMLLGPFVDFNGSKRGWILWGQAIIVAGIIATVFALQMPQFFEITLATLAVTAIFSALCNIATDGFYILSLSKQRQAAYVGLNSTFYRLGRLFCTGLLVLVAGALMRVPSVDVKVSDGQILLEKVTGAKGEEKTEQIARDSATLMIKDERIQSADGLTVKNELPPTDPREKNPTWMKVPPGVRQIEVRETLVVAKKFGSEEVLTLGKLSVVTPRGGTPGITATTAPGTPMHPKVAWGAVLGLCVLIYALGRVILPITLPRPGNDIVRPLDREQVISTLARTLLIVGAFFCTMAFIDKGFKFLGHLVGSATTSLPIVGETKDWTIAPESFQIELLWLIGYLTLGTTLFLLAKVQLKGTEMAEAFGSYIKQDRFAAILGFVIFYRFGEVMVSRVAPLFYQDPTSKGGLALTVEQVGIVNGTMGVVGIILGGIAGGLVVSRLGLRKAFWPLALAMHVPNLLYVWAAKTLPTIPGGAGPQEIMFSPISWIAFVDQFGYGFGFAAYFVYLMWVAQRGKFHTSHYAIGTGLGAFFITSAGLVSAQLLGHFQRANEGSGYFPFFLTVIFFSLPGMLMLLLIPLDEKEGRDIIVTEIAD